MKKLSDGIVAFNHYFVSKIEDLVRVSMKEQRFGEASREDIWEYSQCLEYVRLAFRNLIEIWSEVGVGVSSVARTWSTCWRGT